MTIPEETGHGRNQALIRSPLKASVGVVNAGGVKGKTEGAPSPTKLSTPPPSPAWPQEQASTHGTRTRAEGPCVSCRASASSLKEGEGLRLMQKKKQESPSTRSKLLQGNKKP